MKIYIPFAIVILACLIAFQPSQATRYAIGSPSERHLTYSFWPPQSNAEGMYRWSDGESWLRLFGYERVSSFQISIRLIGPVQIRGEETTIRFVHQGEALVEVPSPGTWRTYHLLLPNDAPGWHTPQVLVGGTLTSPMPDDGREVGVAISQVYAQPIDGLHLLAGLEYALFLSLLLGLIWYSTHWLLGPRWGVGSLLCVGGALLLWVRIDPTSSGFWLPPLWGGVLIPIGSIALYQMTNYLISTMQHPLRWLGIGSGVGLVGNLLVYTKQWPILGFIGLVLGAALVTAAIIKQQPQEKPKEIGIHWYISGLIACLILALGLRSFDLEHLPVGMWRDEARHGLLAIRILNNPGYRPIYVAQADIPALLFYMQSWSVAIFGTTAFAVRIVPALAGALSALSIAYVAHQIWGGRAALTAALLLATSTWHVWLSRLAFAAVLDPLFSLIGLGLLWRIIVGRVSGRDSIIAGFGAGMALGLSLYTYHPARLMPLAAMLWVTLNLGRNWAAWRRALPGIITTAVVALLIVSPLLNYWFTRTQDFNQRVGQVSLLDRTNSEFALTTDLNQNLVRYTLMWHVQGEENARHNIPGTPMLDPLTGFLFLIGLLLLLRKGQAKIGLALFALLGVGLIPGMLSTEAPHAVRTVDAIAPALLIATYAGLRLTTALADQPARLRRSMISVGVAIIGIINAASYFGHVPYDPRVWKAFHYTNETGMGQAIHDGACAGPAFVPEKFAATEVLRYLATGHEVRAFEPEAPPTQLPPGACLFLAGDSSADLRSHIAQQIGIQPQVGRYFPGSEQPIFWIYRLPQAQ